MTIGLNSDELTSVFIKALTTKPEEVKTKLIKDIATLDTEMLKKQFPTLDSQTLIMLLSVVFSFADMVVKNNEALSKIIPHSCS